MIKLICDACGLEITDKTAVRKLNITNTNGAVTRPCGKGIAAEEHTVSAADLCFDCADKIIAILTDKGFAPEPEDEGNTEDNGEEPTENTGE